MHIASQARVLDLAAKSTRDRILHDRRLGVQPREETLTQNFVSDYLARVRRAGLRAKAHEFTKAEESSLVGADLALWFHDGAGNYAGIYLQAKRQFPDDTYRGLNRGGGRQHQTLVEGARGDRVLGGYAFYNGLRDSEPAKAACAHGVGATDISGITIASAASVSAHLRNSVPRVAVEEFCSPLSCLMRHPSRTASAGGDGDARDVGLNSGLPFALIEFAGQWPDSGIEVHTSQTVPAYVHRVEASDAEESLAEPEYGYLSDPPDWWSMADPGERIYERGDLAPTATAMLVGPQ